MVGSVLLYLDARAAEDGLRAAEADLRLAEDAVSAEDFDRAGQLLAAAAEDAEGVLGRLDGPGWALVAQLPKIGDVPALGQATADLVIGTAAVGDEGLALADEVLSPGALSGLVDGGTIDVEALAGLSDRADALDLAPLREAYAELEATSPDRLPGSVVADREIALNRAEELLGTLEAAQSGLDAVVEFVGGDGPRRYLVIAQNPAELRGTGGLIGFMSEISFDEGRVGFRDGFSFDAQEELAQRTKLESTRDLPPPVERPDAFAERYDHVAGGQYFGSVNIDPDLPTVAPVLMRLYEQETGRAVDGVLAVDPLALGGIVAATGEPIDLAVALDGRLPEGIPATVDGAAIAQLVMVDGYDVFGGGGPEKKALDKAVIGASLERFVSGAWDASTMVATLQELLGQRHVQLYSATPDTQAALEAAGVAGQLPDGEVSDVLAVTGVNAAPNKADVHVEHTISGELRLRGGLPVPGLHRDADVRVTVTNPLAPDDHVDYITGSYVTPVPFGSGQQEFEQDASVRTWFSVWTPDATMLRSVRDAASGIALRTDGIHGLQVFDAFLDTPSQDQTAIEVQYGGPVPVERRAEGWAYDLVLWRQAKGIPDLYDLRVVAPDGYRVVDVELSGGEAVPGLSDVELVELTATLEGGDVVLRGHSSRDARLSVVLARAE